MDKIYYVYKIINKINNKIYIGKTATSINKRFKIHLCIARGGKKKYPNVFFAIHSAITKYGYENFQIEKLEETQSESEVFNLEKFWIKKYQEDGIKLYNLTIGGEGPSGRKASKEAKNKMSLAHQKLNYKGGKQKLNSLQILEIKKMFCENKLSQVEIAKIFNVTNQTINGIYNGEQWSWVKYPNFVEGQSRYFPKPTNSKLNGEQVKTIKQLLKTNLTQKEISKMFQVSKQTITLINTGKQWKHIE